MGISKPIDDVSFNFKHIIRARTNMKVSDSHVHRFQNQPYHTARTIM